MNPPPDESPVFEVEFRFQDPSHPFVGASQVDGCRVELAEMIPRSDGRFAEFFNVTGADPDRIESLVAAHGTATATLLTEYENGGLFEFLVTGNGPAWRLAELGALPRSVEGVDGTGWIVAEISPKYDPPAVVDAFLADHPDAELVTKQEKESVAPLVSKSAFQQVLQTHLTDRQREVLRTAFEAGYYDWPRECTGADVAAELAITSATFSEHIHAAERNLLTALFDRAGGDQVGRRRTDETG